MKTNSKLIIFIFTLLALAASAYAQSPREELKQMVEQLRQTPTDNALREKIISFAAKQKPAPVIPEEAERRMARGEAAFERAKDPAEYANAIREFQTAANAAPWLATPYFNLGVTEEKAGHPNEALKNFRWYLLAAPNAKDAVDIRKRLFKLEYAAEQDAKHAVITEQAKRFEGDWYRVAVNAVGDRAHLTLTIRRNAGDVWRIEGTAYSQENNVRDIQLAGPELRFKYDLGVRHPDRIEVTANIQAVATVTKDGSTLRIVTTPMPFTPNQVAHWKKWSNYTPESGVTEYKR